jgi:ABC-type sugar transport system permease subunit
MINQPDEIQQLMQLISIMLVFLMLFVLVAIGLIVYFNFKRNGGKKQPTKLYGEDIVAYVIQNRDTGRSAVVQVENYTPRARVRVDHGDKEIRPTHIE